MLNGSAAGRNGEPVASAHGRRTGAVPLVRASQRRRRGKAPVFEDSLHTVGKTMELEEGVSHHKTVAAEDQGHRSLRP